MNKSFVTRLLFCLLVSVLSCKKENDPITNHLSGSYVTDSLLTISSPVMYTRNSLITDSNFIKSYISRLTSGYINPLFQCTTCSFSFNATTEAATSTIHIDFASPQQGTVEFDNLGKINCLIQVENNNAVFISKDTVPFGSGNNGSPCSQLVNKSIVYKAPYDTCRSLSTSSGGAYSCESQPVELVVSLNGDLYLPQVKAFTGKTGTNIGSCYSPAQFLNVFNPNLQSSLGATDTVVVQRKTWKLKKL